MTLMIKIWKAMIIMAWDGGQPSSVFGADVIKKVLSVFITAAIMKLGQGWSMFISFYLSDEISFTKNLFVQLFLM